MGVFVSRSIRKAFSWENVRNLLKLEYKKYSPCGFFLLLELGLKSTGFHFRKYNNFFMLELESFMSWNIRSFFQRGFFLFFEFGPKSWISWNLRIFQGFCFPKYKETFLGVSVSWNIKIFLNTRARKSHFSKYN